MKLELLFPEMIRGLIFCSYLSDKNIVLPESSGVDGV